MKLSHVIIKYLKQNIFLNDLFKIFYILCVKLSQIKYLFQHTIVI